MNIRKYTDKDYEMICSWWKFHGEPIPPEELISQFTYILEAPIDKPWLCLSLITFNTPWVAWSAGLVSNPDIRAHGRKEAVKLLWDHVADLAKKMGYKNLLCIAPCESLEKRYAELGFVATKRNQTFMVKSLGE